ncbi:MAG TPA: methyltransferase [Anaeromyxobacter sp.]|nr:methyltransferase [Anaeromyxobacter sp.]
MAFVAMPAMVAGVVPGLLLRIDRWRGPPRTPGVALAALGAAGLLWCVRDFYVIGKGTLAPWAPPRRLVVRGLYRFVRNPMYVSVLATVAGLAWWRASPVLAGYAAALAIAFHLRVVLGEEPVMAQRFGEEWTAYRAAVRRWVPGRPRG